MLTDLPDPCRTCAFDGATLTTADLLVTIRSLPRRWRAILVRDDDAATTAPPGGGPSAAELAGEVVAALGTAVAAVEDAAHGRPAAPPLTAGGSATAEDVAGAAEALATAVVGVDDDHQRATAPAARAGAHAGVHPLRAAQAAVDAVVAARD